MTRTFSAKLPVRIVKALSNSRFVSEHLCLLALSIVSSGASPISRESPASSFVNKPIPFNRTISESFHISLCTLKKEVRKWKLEFVTKNKFYKIEKNEFEGSVLECVAKYTIIVNPCLHRCPNLKCSAKVQVRGAGPDVDG